MVTEHWTSMSHWWGGSLEDPKQFLFLIALVAEINVTVGAVTKGFIF